ncbi:hypothetical protein LJ737_12095 [Hymenobacter sp. 15J16-1T3B]|uniref:hypothetical protein n=1 Tax=Hymenobacter sp. 15J16-1T3B TaxID=2886941 RepID=UPI001D105BA9|nr:hypothetical protein [Hymenobacter sp. 15J16-1T3B]MCC3157983.1 hypothetical protein [Hymenobacter sp. 15J16-1T3B]
MNRNLGKSIIDASASSLTDITKDVTEAAIDSLLQDGVVKDIPLVNLIHSVYKIGSGIRERIFINMLLKFLFELKDIPIEERMNFISKLENEDYKNKAGEKIMVILDKLDDSDKAPMVGRVFRACLQGKFTFNVFLRLSHVINNAFVDDIKSLGNCFTPSGATYQLGAELADSLNRVGLTTAKLKADPYTQERFKRTTGRDATSVPYEYNVVHTLNNDALILAREIFDFEWIEHAYHIYK